MFTLVVPILRTFFREFYWSHLIRKLEALNCYAIFHDSQVWMVCYSVLSSLLSDLSSFLCFSRFQPSWNVNKRINNTTTVPWPFPTLASTIHCCMFSSWFAPGVESALKMLFIYFIYRNILSPVDNNLVVMDTVRWFFFIEIFIVFLQCLREFGTLVFKFQIFEDSWLS